MIGGAFILMAVSLAAGDGFMMPRDALHGVPSPTSRLLAAS